jgi:hypothetical protein
MKENNLPKQKKAKTAKNSNEKIKPGIEEAKKDFKIVFDAKFTMPKIGSPVGSFKLKFDKKLVSE